MALDILSALQVTVETVKKYVDNLVVKKADAAQDTSNAGKVWTVADDGGLTFSDGSAHSVQYVPQTLDEEQKLQARNNIGVGETIADTLISLELAKPLVEDDDDVLATVDGVILVYDKDEDKFVKTVNGIEPDENGNVEIKADSGASSWNDLEDKPFGEEIVVGEEIFPETTLDFKADDQSQAYGLVVATIELDRDMIEDGKTYNFVIDGISYETKPFFADGQVMLGNAALMVPESEDNGLPFAAGFVTYGSGAPADILAIFLVGDSDAQHTVSISGSSSSIKTLDEKYIPDTIARVSDVVTSVNGMTGDVVIDGGSGGVSSWNDLTDKPFEVAAKIYEYNSNTTYDEVIVVPEEESAELVKISDDVVESDMFIGGSIVVQGTFNGESATESMPITEDVITSIDGAYLLLNGCIVVTAESVQFHESTYDIIIPRGVWVPNLAKISPDNLTIEYIRFLSRSTPVPESVIPDTIARVEDITWDNIPDKPFYNSYVEVIPEQNYMIYRDADNLDVVYSIISLSDAYFEKIEEGKTYAVSAFGSTVICVAQKIEHEWFTGIILGNPYWAGASADYDNGLDFAVMYRENDDGTVFKKIRVTNDPVTGTFGVHLIVPICLDEKFIPDSIARKSDVTWDNLSDKPFYEETSEVELYRNDSLAFVENSNIYATEPLQGTFALEDGKTYRVEWDGTEYTCICSSPPFAETDPFIITYLGNMSIGRSDYENTGEPFVIQCMQHVDTAAEGYNAMAIGTTSTLSTHSVVISGETSIVTALDEKFIPDSIVRKADVISTPVTAQVGQTIVVKAVDENGKPTEWECVDMPSWIPEITEADEGAILRVVNGVPTWVAVTDAQNTTF